MNLSCFAGFSCNTSYSGSHGGVSLVFPYCLVLPQVEGLLLSEPDNQEYAEIYRSLTEAIELTEELLKETEPDAQPSSAQGNNSHLLDCLN